MKYFALLLCIFAAIAHSQAPAYGYIRGRVTLTDNFPVSSLPVYLNSNTVYTDDNGRFIALQQSGDIKIKFQSSIINVNLPPNEIIDIVINSTPIGVIIDNYSEDKMPSSARFNDDDITDIRYVNNSIWLPQCYRRSGLLTIFHDNEYAIPYNSSSTYTLENINVQKFNRKLPITGSISVKNSQKMSGNQISFRYLQGDNIWRTSIIKSDNKITNLPINKYFLISFNTQNGYISKRLIVDLNEVNKEVTFTALQPIKTTTEKVFYQDTKGFYSINSAANIIINRPIFNNKVAMTDNKSTGINYESNTSIKLIIDRKPTQYTRYKWMVYEDNNWRDTESEWLYDRGEYPSAIINKLTSGTSRDFIVYSTSNYIPEVWCSNDLIIPFPDYSPVISKKISLTDLPNLKGRVTRSKGELPPTSRISISPIDIKPILKNLTSEIERELRLYNVNFDINTGDFNIILPGHGKYLLRFYTTDHSFPENEIIIEKNTDKSYINFCLKQ